MDIEETNGKQNIKLAEHEIKIDIIGKNVDKIMSNHLPHIQTRLDKIDTRLAYWGGGLAALTILVPIIIRLME